MSAKITVTFEEDGDGGMDVERELVADTGATLEEKKLAVAIFGMLSVILADIEKHAAGKKVAREGGAE